MAIELRRKSDNSLVKPGEYLTTNGGKTIIVKEIMGPSHRYGSSPILDADGSIRLPSDVGCYSTTV